MRSLTVGAGGEVCRYADEGLGVMALAALAVRRWRLRSDNGSWTNFKSAYPNC